MSALLPEGVASLADAPYNLADAITMALGFLSFEEQAPEDRPPKRIWFDADALRAHWAEVKRRWASKSRGDADDISDRPIDDPVDNPAAENLIVGA